MALRQISRATCRHLNRPTLSLLSIYTSPSQTSSVLPPSFLLPFNNHERFAPTPVFTSTQRRSLSLKFPVAPNLGPQFIEEERVRFPYDDEITALNPSFIDETSKLVGIFPIEQILRSYDREKYHLVHIHSPDSLSAESEGHIVRLFPKSLLLERIEADRAEVIKNKKKKKSGRDTVKEVQISWGIDPHDLSHHLKKVGKFLEKGNKVEITIAKKKRQPKVSPEKLNEMMAIIDEFLYYNGGELSKGKQGELGVQLKMEVQRPENWVPPPPKPEPRASEPVEDGVSVEGMATSGHREGEGTQEGKKEHVPAWQARGEVS
ncbi:hypothetical protein ABW20_dc0102451 [Dactylellina cionopaga]|nr:hypothetical protein ABW20_dc0102451 [Dactylellina cionopaga]